MAQNKKKQKKRKKKLFHKQKSIIFAKSITFKIARVA